MSANPRELFTVTAGSGKPLVGGAVPRTERRKRVRTKVHWTILLFRGQPSEAVETVTRDLSSSGFYCMSRLPFAQGEMLTCSLKVPAYDPFSIERTLQLECRARVVRCQAEPGNGLYGVACHIEDYRFAPTGDI